MLLALIKATRRRAVTFNGDMVLYYHHRQSVSQPLARVSLIKSQFSISILTATAANPHANHTTAEKKKRRTSSHPRHEISLSYVAEMILNSSSICDMGETIDERDALGIIH